MSEGMGMDHLRVEAELVGKALEPERQPARGKGFPVSVPEQVPAVHSFFPEPLLRLFPQFVGNIDSPDFSPFRIQVHVPRAYVFNFHLEKFADPGARSAHEPDGEIPLVIPAVLQLLFEVPVVCVADDVLQESPLRILYTFYFISLPVNIHIRKEGLEIGESAKFKIERTTDGTKWDPVTSVFVTRTANDDKTGENAPIAKIYGLPATDDSTPAKKYNYRIIEEPWSWSYNSGTKTPTTTDLLEVNPFIFTNAKKENIDNEVKNGESKTFNTFLPGNTEGSYVDSKPRTTTTTP